MISINDFIRCYNEKSQDRKQEYIEKHIVVKYIPYTEKIALCESIIKNTCTVTIDDKTMFSSNSPAREMFFKLALIKKYTDIEIDFSKCVEQYDLLEEKEITFEIISLLPEVEIERLNNMLSSMLEDYMMNNRDLVSYIETKIDSLEILFNEMGELMTQNVNSEE